MLLHEGTYKLLSERVMQECQLLCMIKHPNIVLYLGTSRDPKSHRFYLLMELMNESLTKFLQASSSPLPYHVQLNICFDVALALSYLHSNTIIHNNLSSNSVMLIGRGSRAKLTDFWVSKVNMTQHLKNTVYMPPEMRIIPPQYSSKVDCFSYGVLTIQIATRNYPKPESEMSLKTSEVVPETERRRNDIDLVESNHSLLPIALSCLKDNDMERPSAEEVLKMLTVLKEEVKYLQSVKGACNITTERDLVTLLQRELKQCQIEVQKERDQLQYLRKAIFSSNQVCTCLYICLSHDRHVNSTQSI